jgi:hypothetical protein
MNPATEYPIGFCQTPREYNYLIDFMKETNWVQELDPPSETTRRVLIAPEGWAHLRGIGDATQDQAFVAMSFKSELTSAWTDGISPGIEKAGYKAVRIDKKVHNNRIDDEIIAEIRRARFVVADLTLKNAGAYFEAGFAMGLGKPVIWTCRQAEIDSGGVHFDTRQYSIVPWVDNEWPEFAKRLTQRIEATLGHGRYKAP